MTTSKPVTLLVDGDILLYHVCSVNEEETRWPGDIWTLHSDGKACREQCDRALLKMREELKGDRIVVCFSDPTGEYFRKDLYPLYKAKRDGRNRTVKLSFGCLSGQSLLTDGTIAGAGGHDRARRANAA